MRISLITVCHNSRLKIASYVCSFLEHHTLEEDRKRYQFVFIENSGDADFDEAVQPLVDSGFDVILLSSENEGFGIGCNVGAQHALGDLLFFVNPDIRFLCNLGSLLVSAPPVKWGTIRQVIVGNRIYSIDLLPEYKGLIFELLKLHRLVNLFPSYFLRRSYVVGSFMIISRELYFQAGGFDPAFFLYYEEAELARRLQVLSGPPYLNLNIAVFHEGFGSHSSREAILKHEAKGFLTYCHVTDQPELIHRRLKILRVLGLLSDLSKSRYQILLNAALVQDSKNSD